MRKWLSNVGGYLMPHCEIPGRLSGSRLYFSSFSDVIIDPVALQGERWFLGKIYGYPHEVIYFGIPLVNFAGWAVVVLMSFVFYRWLERGQFASESVPNEMVSGELFLGIGLYYGVLAFNLGVTFWIVEIFMGMVGCFIFVPLTAALLVTLCEDRRFLRVHDALK